MAGLESGEGCGLRGDGCVAFEQDWAVVGIPALDSHAQGGVHFIDSAYALEGFGLCVAGQFVEELKHGRVVEHVLAKNGVELLRRNERGEDDVGEQAFGATSAPDVLFAARVAAAENGMVLPVAAGKGDGEN